MDVLSAPLETVQSYRNLGRPGRAREVLYQIPLSHRVDERFEKMEVEVFLDLENWPKALEIAKELVYTVPDDPEAHIMLAESYHENGKLEVAYRILSRAPEEARFIGRFWYILARVYARTSQPDEAKRCLAQAIRLDPDIIKKAVELPGMTRLLNEM